MLAAVRHQKILEKLGAEGAVKVSELSGWLQVTEKTIREDLVKLEEKGLLSRIHGGAVPAVRGEDSLLPEFPDTRRQSAKAAIAACALQYVKPGDILALDAGSTLLELARQLPNEAFTVVTNDLLIIRELALKDKIRLVVPGGYRYRNVLVGSEAMAWAGSLNVHKLFLSTTGIHVEDGFSVFTGELMALKRIYMSCAKEIYCLADHTKFDKGALFTFARLDEVRTIITDEGLPEDAARKYERQGVVIRRAGSAGIQPH